jgi:broad specificity phosphatase PhoE
MTEYNEDHRHDFNNLTTLTTTGMQQAEEVSSLFGKLSMDDLIVVVSPLSRTLQTITPFLKTFLKANEISAIEKKYLAVQKEYLALCDTKKIQEYLQNTKEKHFYKLHEKVYVDMRVTDILVPEIQDKVRPKELTTSMPTSQKLTPKGESMDDIFARTKAYMYEVNNLFPTKTIITISHEDTIIAMAKAFRNFDYLIHKKEFAPSNIQIETFYRDTDRHAEVDLHKPYIDTYRFMKDGHVYKRVPEVMDCWFES